MGATWRDSEEGLLMTNCDEVEEAFCDWTNYIYIYILHLGFRGETMVDDQWWYAKSQIDIPLVWIIPKMSKEFQLANSMNTFQGVIEPRSSNTAAQVADRDIEHQNNEACRWNVMINWIPLTGGRLGADLDAYSRCRETSHFGTRDSKGRRRAGRPESPASDKIEVSAEDLAFILCLVVMRQTRKDYRAWGTPRTR